MKRLALALLFLLPSLLLVAQFVVAQLPLDRVRPALERDLGEILDREVHIQGPIRAQLIPWLRLELRRVVVENLAGRTSEALLDIRRLELEVRLLPLLRNQLVFEAIELDGVDLRIEPDASGSWPLRASLDELDEAPGHEEDDPVRFALRRLRMIDLRVVLDPHGWSPVHSIQVDELFLSATDRDAPIDLEVSGRFEGGDFDVVATLGSPAELAAPTRPFPIHLDAKVIEGHLDIDGHLEDPVRLGALELVFEARIHDPAARLSEVGLPIGPLGSIDLRGRLLGRDGGLAVEDLEIRSRGDGPLELTASGRIGDLGRLRAFDLGVELAMPDVRLFSDVAGVPLPAAALQTTLQLHDVDDRVRIQGEAELRARNAFTARATGRIDDALSRPAFDLLLELASNDVESLTDAFGLEEVLPEANLGPVRASGHLGTKDDLLRLDALALRIGDPAGDHAEVEGEIGDVIRQRDIVLRTRIVSASLEQLASRFGQRLPPIGPLDVSFTLHDADGTPGLEELDLALGKAGDFSIVATGRIDDLRARTGLDLETSVYLNDLDELSDLLEADLPDLGPFDYRATIRGSLDDLRSTGSLRVKDTLFEGGFDRVAADGRRPRIELGIHSSFVRLSDLITPAPALEKRPLQRRLGSQFDLGAWWREGTAHLPLDVLRGFDARIRLDADRIVGTDFLEVEDAALSAHLEEGRLVVDEAHAAYESGGISAQLEVDASDSQPRFGAALEAFNVDVTRLISQFREETDHAGQLDLSVELATAGATAREFRSNLDGRIGAMLREGNLVGDYAKKFAFDVLRVSVPKFSFSDDEDAAVQCLLALAPIRGGMAELDTFYLEGPRLTVRGTGRIDLVRNAYDLRLEPEPHEPGLVSVAATVQVAGPLDDPIFHPLAGSMFKSAFDGLWRNSLRPIKAIDRLVRGGNREEAAGPCDVVVRHRVDQLNTRHVEPIDLDEIVARRSDRADADGAQGSERPR